METILIASDHAGFDLKEKLTHFFNIELFLIENYNLIDLGPTNKVSVDYPDYASAVAQKVSKGEASKGILICGTGIGMCIVANKYPNIRAAVAYDEMTAKLCAEHNNANVLGLGGRLTSLELAQKIIVTWLTTPFGDDRHQNRINKISQIENNLCKVEINVTPK